MSNWVRDGQRVIYSKDNYCTEALITSSRTTLGGRIKHYAINNEGDEVLFYEEDVLQTIEDEKIL